MPWPALAEGIVSPLVDPGILQLPVAGLTGSQFLWLLAAGVVLPAAFVLFNGRGPVEKSSSGKESGIATPALLLPGGMLVLVFELLLWGLLESGIGLIAGAVFGVLLGICSIQFCLRRFIRLIEPRLGAAGPDRTATIHAAVRVLFESLGIAVLLFLLSFVPHESSIFVVLAFVMGQVLVVRLAAVERDNFETAAGGDIFVATAALTVRQNIVLVAIACLFSMLFEQFTMAAAELLVWLLGVRLLQPVAILFLEWQVIGRLVARLGVGVRRELGTWINGVASLAVLFGFALLVLRVWRAEGFWIHHHFWWIVPLVAGLGLGIRLAMEEAGQLFAAWLQANQPRQGDRALMALNGMRSGEGLTLLGGLLVAIALFDTEPMRILLTDPPVHLAWGLALGLFAFGYSLGDALHSPESVPAGQPPMAEPAPRYDLELLALAAVAVLLLADSANGTDPPFRHFSLMNAKVAIGIVMGVLLHGFVFPFSLPMPVTGSSNSGADRMVMNVRRVHSFLALFFLQLGLALGLSLFSVFAFTTAVFVMAVMDVFIAPGKGIEERFNMHSWLCFSLLGVAIATEIIRAFGENGMEIFTLFGGAGIWLADHLAVDWLRYLLGTAIAGVGAGIGILLHVRGTNYRPPKDGR